MKFQVSGFKFQVSPLGTWNLEPGTNLLSNI